MYLVKIVININFKNIRILFMMYHVAVFYKYLAICFLTERYVFLIYFEVRFLIINMFSELEMALYLNPQLWWPGHLIFRFPSHKLFDSTTSPSLTFSFPSKSPSRTFGILTYMVQSLPGSAYLTASLACHVTALSLGICDFPGM